MESTQTTFEATTAVKEIFKNLTNEFYNNPIPDFKYRLNGLERLEENLLKYRIRFSQALKQDLNKSEYESDTSELLTCLIELRTAKKNLKKWMRPRKVRTPIYLIGSSHFTRYEPKGVVLIISPWNYPVNLSIIPLIAAWTAGNKIILKPSEYSKKTAEILTEFIAETFSEKDVVIINGNAEIAKELGSLPFNHIFFTGSQLTAKSVLQQAAQNLTTVTLELGGKTPLIIDQPIDLKSFIKDIVYSKCINAGQTCVSPDFILIPTQLRDELVSDWNAALFQMYGPDPISNMDYCGIVNEFHYLRLLDLIKASLIQGAILSEPLSLDPVQRKIKPVLLLNSEWHHYSMQQEIFGPVLPVLSYDSIDWALEYLKRFDRPLTLYIFSNNNKFKEKILNALRSGGVSINNCLLNYCNFDLPFGGDHQSGHGANHGFHGFETFSHRRSISIQGKLFNPLRLFYPPFSNFKIKVKQLAIKYLGKI